MTINQVWTEKYRPQTIEDVVLNEADKEFFLSLKEGIPNNLLLIGSPGIGKTTVAKILAKQFAPYSYLYIKASEQGNIETVRTIISEFISVSSIDGNQKIVILDECDGTSFAAQEALRSVMEEFLDTVRFILTANYRNKLIEPIRSRCKEFTFSFTEKQHSQIIVKVLRAEQIEIPKEEIANLKILLKEFFPDIRKTLNELQCLCMSGTFKYVKKDHSDFAKQIKDDLANGKDVFALRQTLIENIDKFSGDYHSLMKNLFTLYARECNSVACILLSEYMYRHSFVIDQEVNFSALLFNLKNKLPNTDK